MSWLQTAERVTDDIGADNYVYQRCLAAYTFSAEMISGDVLEVGTGSGYGLGLVVPKADKFVTIDKFDNQIDFRAIGNNIEFKQMTIPPFNGLSENSFDYIISFQVIEHIVDDHGYLSGIQHLLKPGGKFIVSTPNIKTTLSRNPWHIREYTVDQLQNLMLKYYSDVDTMGVFGNEKVMEYYEENKQSVENLTKWDVFNLQWRLPRQILQIPFDIMNRLNRKKLMNANNELVASITQEDFLLRPADDNCLDLFFIGTK